jgi:hypothetical protein
MCKFYKSPKSPKSPKSAESCNGPKISESGQLMQVANFTCYVLPDAHYIVVRLHPSYMAM